MCERDRRSAARQGGVGDDNYRARGNYDQHASRASWVTYDMEPADSPT